MTNIYQLMTKLQNKIAAMQYPHPTVNSQICIFHKIKKLLNLMVISPLLHYYK